MSIPMEAVKKAILPVAGFLNRVRLGFPRHYFQGAGGMGDDLMGTTVYHELRRRGARGIAVTTRHPSILWNNPDVDKIVWNERPRLNRWLLEGLPFTRLGYAHYDSDLDRDEPLEEHVLKKICRLSAISGPIELRPYLFLTREELAAGRLSSSQIAVQSSALGATFPIRNKEWYPERFQEISTELSAHYTLVQIGSGGDPRLSGTLDLRGKTSLRESAAILANSLVFIGLEGFLMHLARAVDCRSVIIYGGRLRPWQIGYTANANLIGDTPCSPCWLRNRCDYEHACMNMITEEAVLGAVKDRLCLHGQPLDLETVEI